MKTIYNLSYDIPDDELRDSIIEKLYEAGDIDEYVEFIILGEEHSSHIILKPAATTLIFYSSQTYEKIMGDLLLINGQNRFALFEITLTDGQQLSGCINSLDLQHQADIKIQGLINKKRNSKDLIQRMDNIEYQNKKATIVYVNSK